MRILVIEDETKTAAFLAKGLREAGFVVDLARDGETGLERARAIKLDLLIVDVMLPNKDGWEVVAELRRDGIRTPILFLTARDSVRDRVKGLELGADDYLVKPFRVFGTARPGALGIAARTGATGRTFAHRRFGNRHAAAQGGSFRRAAQSHAQGVPSPRLSGSLGRRSCIAR